MTIYTPSRKNERALCTNAHVRARCAHKLLEGTLIQGTLIKNLIEVRPLVYYPTLNKEDTINLTRLLLTA